jgi:GcrA cell cycle regulator
MGECWSKQAEAQLKVLVESGDYSFDQIAKAINREFKMGISRSAAIGKTLRLGLKGPRSGMFLRKARTHLPQVPGAMPRSTPRPRTAPRPPPSPSSGPPETAAPYVPPVAIRDLTPLLMADDVILIRACRWPIGDPGEEGFGWCGRDRRPDHKNYCEAHAAAASKPPSAAKVRDLNRLAGRFA